MNLCIVGLGNPGKNYHGTRHNIGFMVVDLLAEKLKIRLKKGFFSNYCYGEGIYRNNNIYLVKPLTYMNRSGQILESLICKKKIDPENIVIVCDSLDLYPGVVRFKIKGSDGGHNGLKSVIKYNRSDEIKRFMLGIGRPENSSGIVNYVLGLPDNDEYSRIDKGIRIAVDGILMLFELSAEQVMNEINKIKNRSDN